MIGTLTSGRKPIHKYPRQFEVFKYILKDFMVKSNGGIIPTEINQKKLWNIEVNGIILSHDIITKVLKFCKTHDIMVPTSSYSPTNHAKFYVGGKLMKQLLESNQSKPMKLKKETKPKYLEKMRTEYINYGFNPDDRQTCSCCNNYIRIINFKIWDDDWGLSLAPVCKSCHVKTPDAAKSALRLFFLERDKQFELDCLKQINDEDDLNDYIDKMEKSMT